MKKKNIVLDFLIKEYNKNKRGMTAQELSQLIEIDRSNVSAYLNRLCAENKASKTNTRPVYFTPVLDKQPDYSLKNTSDLKRNSFSSIIGKTHSLKLPIEQAKAAVLYPPNGLHTIIYGETGVGKSMLQRP